MAEQTWRVDHRRKSSSEEEALGWQEYAREHQDEAI